MSARIKITKSFLDRLEATGKRVEYHDSIVVGLLLRVSPDATNRVWYLIYKNQEGTRKRFRIGTTLEFDPESAKKKARTLQVKVAAGEDLASIKREKQQATVLAQSRTLRGFVEGDYWKKHLKGLKSGEDGKRLLLAQYPDINDKDMASLTVGQMTKLVAERAERGIQKSTLNRGRTAIMSALNKAVLWGVLDFNPLTNWKPLKNADKHRVRYLGQRDDVEEFEHGELKRFDDALQHEDTPEYLRAVCLLALHTGMRRTEILTLQWRIVHLNKKEIHLEYSSTKSGKARTVYLDDVAISVLKEWRTKVQHISGYVFINPRTKKPYTNLKKTYASFVKRANLTDFRFHDLRHTFCSFLIQKGVPLATVQVLAGHEKIETTLRYAHQDNAKLHEAIKGIFS